MKKEKRKDGSVGRPWCLIGCLHVHMFQSGFIRIDLRRKSHFSNFKIIKAVWIVIWTEKHA